MSNTTDRYELSNVFTSRTTRMSHLMYSRVVRPVPLTRETNSFSPHTTEPWWWCVNSYESYDSSTMNIHYGNHENETSRQAVLFIHECGAFRTRNTTFFLRTSRVAFQHNKDYCCCLCTLRGDFRMRNTLVIWALCVALLVVWGSSCLCTTRGGFMIKKSPR